MPLVSEYCFVVTVNDTDPIVAGGSSYNIKCHTEPSMSLYQAYQGIQCGGGINEALRVPVLLKPPEYTQGDTQAVF